MGRIDRYYRDTGGLIMDEIIEYWKDDDLNVYISSLSFPSNIT